MEQNYDFLWVRILTSSCLLCGGTNRPQEVRIVVMGIPDGEIRLEGARCRRCGCRYGELSDLMEHVKDVGSQASVITGFRIGGRRLHVGAEVAPASGCISWARLQELLEEMPVPDEEVPAMDVVRALPQLEETWEVNVSVADWISEGDQSPMLSYVAVVLDGREMMRSVSLQANRPHEAEDLAAVVLQAAARPRAPVDPGRPRAVVVKDVEQARTLGLLLNSAGIPVHPGSTPLADAVVSQMLAEMRHPQVGPFLIDYDSSEIRGYFRAARAFFSARPWLHFAGDRYLAFRIEDGAWCYAAIIGQAGMEAGLTVFDSWLQLCRFVHNGQSYFENEEEADSPLLAAGSLEGVALSPLPALHPEDAEYLRQLSVLPLRHGLYPLPHRYLPSRQEEPSILLSVYRRVMEAVTGELKRRGNREVASINKTVEVDGVPIALRYPAKGREELEPDAGSFRLVVTGEDSRGTALPAGARIEIDAPGEARIDRVCSAIKRAGGEPFWGLGLLSGAYYIWNADNGSGAPTPCVGHLAGHRSLYLELIGGTYSVQVMRRLQRGPAELAVRIIEGG